MKTIRPELIYMIRDAINIYGNKCSGDDIFCYIEERLLGTEVFRMRSFLAWLMSNFHKISLPFRKNEDYQEAFKMYLSGKIIS